LIGGGIINGLSLQGVWPRERLNEILAADKELKALWPALLEVAATMADNGKVRNGTRYDALRILGIDSWERRAAQLKKYLAKGTNGELQQGAVSGLSDVKVAEAATSLAGAFKNLTPHNQKFALEALLRDESRIPILLDAIEKSDIPASALSGEQKARLARLSDEKLRQRAEAVLKP
jgi:hypothetical protein